MKQSAQKNCSNPFTLVYSFSLLVVTSARSSTPATPLVAPSVCPCLRSALRSTAALLLSASERLPYLVRRATHAIQRFASPRALPRLTHCSARHLMELMGTHTLLIACEAHVDATCGARALLVAHGARPAPMKPALSSPHRHPRR
jgi:hypothetical protein